MLKDVSTICGCFYVCPVYVYVYLAGGLTTVTLADPEPSFAEPSWFAVIVHLSE